MYIQWTRVLYSVVITWQPNPRISQLNSPCNKFTSFCSSLYTLHEVFIMLLLLKTFIVFDEIPCASFKYKQLVERKYEIGRLWETLGDFGRLWETLGDSCMILTTVLVFQWVYRVSPTFQCLRPRLQWCCEGPWSTNYPCRDGDDSCHRNVRWDDVWSWSYR